MLDDVAAGVLLPLALVQGALRPVGRRWRAVLALSVLEVALPLLLIAQGEQHITSSLAGLLIAADPLFIVLLALRFDQAERASGIRLGLGFAGVVALLGVNPGGDALGVLGGAMVLLAAVWLAPIAAVNLPSVVPSVVTLVSLLVLGLACTALGFLVYFSLIAAAGATRASLITYVNPAIAVVLGVAVLHETITLATLVGFGLILGGCWLCTRPAAAPAPERRLASAVERR